MRIVSLNAWGGRLFEAMTDWLADVQPDVLCLQEVVFAPGSPSAWLDYRDGDLVLPQRADVIRDREQAVDAAVSKAKQMIDQMGARLFN